MPEKKKTVPPRATSVRMAKPHASKFANTSPATASRQGVAAVAQLANPEKQLESFEAAMKLFHARKLKDARPLFAAAAAGPERDVAQRARLHMAMCDRRLQETTVNLHSAEDYYNYGVALINTRKVVEARTTLEKALEMAPGADHIHYALALAQALGGDLTSAHENLKRAIELEPRNRIIARQDLDFAPLTRVPPFDALLYPEKKNW